MTNVFVKRTWQPTSKKGVSPMRLWGKLAMTWPIWLDASRLGTNASLALAIDCMLACVELQLQFEVATVTSLLSMTVANKFSMGSKELRCAVTKLFKLFAMTSFSLPPCHHWTCPFVDVGCQVLFSKTLVITFDQDCKAILIG